MPKYSTQYPKQWEAFQRCGSAKLISIEEKFDLNRPIIFYLAIASSLFGNSCRFIRDSGLNIPQSRLVIENPMGKKELTAIQINNEIMGVITQPFTIL